MNRSRAILFSSLIVLSLGLFSCDKDLPAPFQSEADKVLPAPTNVSVKLGAGRVYLNWNYATNSYLEEFRVYRKDGEDQEFARITSTTNTSYVDTMLINGREYFYEIAAVDKKGFEGFHSKTISIIPAIFSILVEEGAEATKNREVKLRITAPPNAAYMMLSNDSTFEHASWEVFAENRTWELSQGDGPKTIYGKFRDDNDYETEVVVKAHIRLDTFAQIFSLEHDGKGRVLAENDVLHIRMSTSDTYGIASISIIEPDTIVTDGSQGKEWVKDLKLFDNGSWGDQVANDGVYEYDYIVDRGLEVPNARLVGEFADALDNKAITVDAINPVVLSQKPTIIQLLEPGSGGQSTPSLALRWTANNDFDFAFYQLYRSTSYLVGFSSVLVAEIKDPQVTRYVDTKLEPSTVYYYRMYVFDKAGNYSASNLVSVKSPPNQPPKPVVLSQAINDDSTSLTLTWSPSTADDFASYQLFRSLSEAIDTTFAPIRIFNYYNETEFQDKSAAKNITYFYQIFVEDIYGLKTGSNIVSGRIE